MKNLKKYLGNKRMIGLLGAGMAVFAMFFSAEVISSSAKKDFSLSDLIGLNTANAEDTEGNEKECYEVLERGQKVFLRFCLDCRCKHVKGGLDPSRCSR